MAPEGNIAGVTPAHIEGERHVSEVAGTASPQRKKMVLYTYCAVAAIVLGIMAYNAATEGDRKAVKAAEKGPAAAVQLKGKRGFEEAPALPAVASLDAPPEDIPPLPTDAELAGASAPADGARVVPGVDAGGGAVRLPGGGRLVVYTGTAGSVVSAVRSSLPTSQIHSEGQAPNSANELAAQLSPAMEAKGVRATVLRNQPYLLTAGTLVPCTLQTAMDSTLAGFVTCIVPQDVVGKSGLTLLDRGTKIVGEFRGGATRGKPRLFVVWTRAETPQGVVIDLNSPAADALGRSGLQGEVDNRFWDRFGAALLLSTVESGLQAVVNAQSKEGSTTVNTSASNDVVDSILQDSLNLPPIIRKHQGELVSIFVRQDLDFSTVYGISPVQRAQVATVRK